MLTLCNGSFNCVLANNLPSLLVSTWCNSYRAEGAKIQSLLDLLGCQMDFLWCRGGDVLSACNVGTNPFEFRPVRKWGGCKQVWTISRHQVLFGVCSSLFLFLAVSLCPLLSVCTPPQTPRALIYVSYNFTLICSQMLTWNCQHLAQTSDGCVGKRPLLKHLFAISHPALAFRRSLFVPQGSSIILSALTITLLRWPNSIRADLPNKIQRNRQIYIKKTLKMLCVDCMYG